MIGLGLVSCQAGEGELGQHLISLITAAIQLDELRLGLVPFGARTSDGPQQQGKAATVDS
jgi:hypothetical protein